ncbi:hypothetical protein C9422_28505 [Pseudomonas sp. B1(2018)]|nr:hypothetical protein C9422_28505 [Pseudomonas sp. B1(2018)]
MTSQVKPVGAGLLAKTECQSTSLLSDTTLSRASPLPHLSVVLLTPGTDPSTSSGGWSGC